MAKVQSDRENSAARKVLPFPNRHEYRPVQSEIGMGSAGFLSLMLLDRDGETRPANVQRFDEPEGVSAPSKSPELLLAMLVWEQLPAEGKASVGRCLRAMAYAEVPDQSAVQLLNLFCKRR